MSPSPLNSQVGPSIRTSSSTTSTTCAPADTTPSRGVSSSATACSARPPSRSPSTATPTPSTTRSPTTTPPGTGPGPTRGTRAGGYRNWALPRVVPTLCSKAARRPASAGTPASPAPRCRPGRSTHPRNSVASVEAASLPNRGCSARSAFPGAQVGTLPTQPDPRSMLGDMLSVVTHAACCRLAHGQVTGFRTIGHQRNSYHGFRQVHHRSCFHSVGNVCSNREALLGKPLDCCPKEPILKRCPSCTGSSTHSRQDGPT